MRAPGNPTLCGTSATFKGVQGARRASRTAAGSSPRDGRRAMGPMSLLRTTGAPTAFPAWTGGRPASAP